VLVHVFRLDITHAGQTQGAERIESDQFHGDDLRRGALF
jgi:hypothetical protein